MVVFNPQKKEIDIKIVYYGPALCGKTTNLKSVHLNLNPHQRGELVSLATKDDRTLFFDFLPIQLENIKGFKTRFHIYTVPGQVFYTLTRKAVLTGVDGVIFVADSQKNKMKENIESLNDLKDNLKYYNKTLETIPLVFQYNKRDLPDAVPISEMNGLLNLMHAPYFEACALSGNGVMETLTMCCRMVLKQMQNRARTDRSMSTSSVSETVVTSSPAENLPQLTLTDRTQIATDHEERQGPANAEVQQSADEIGSNSGIHQDDQQVVRSGIHEDISDHATPQVDTYTSSRQQQIPIVDEMQERPSKAYDGVAGSGEDKFNEVKRVCPRCSLKFKSNVKQCPICRVMLLPEQQNVGSKTGIGIAPPIIKPSVANQHKSAQEISLVHKKPHSEGDQPQLEIVSCNQPLKVSAHTLVIPLLMKVNGNEDPVKVELTISINHVAMNDSNHYNIS